MSSSTATSNVVTVARLNAALDGVEHLESLLEDMLVPLTAARRARRLGMLVAEMRDIVVDLLRPEVAA